ncbi:MAG: ImmA/IrrE family metallo-endopeptidase, partial [Pseudomonadota bacterium]
MRSPKTLSARVRERIAIRFTLSASDLYLCSRAVHHYGQQLGCAVFDAKLPSERWFRRYIDQQPNIHFVDKDIGLSRNIHGAVIKKRLSDEAVSSGNHYFLFVSPKIGNRLHRCFTIAHELGHILLHGRILHPGMLVARRSQSWHTSNRKFGHLMEVEANLYAMLSLVPSSLIVSIRKAVGECSPNRVATVLQCVLRILYDAAVDIQFVRERLIIQELIDRNDDTLAIRSFLQDEQLDML